MQAVWPSAIVEDANLTVAVSQLRKALNQNGDNTEGLMKAIQRRALSV
jgi:DNA-binding winged helix-turn-helix (wHTH) protein